MSILVVDLGGTVIKVGRVEGGRILQRQCIEGRCEAGAAQALSRLAELLRSMRADDCTGVGLALPALVDTRVGRVLADMIGKYEGLSSTDWTAWAVDELRLPIRIENDAHAALLGEWRYGAGRGCDDLVMATLGTGIGTSVLIGGRALRGCHAQAGNLGGHFVIDAAGFDCVCGARGCLEAQQNRIAIASIARADPRFANSALAGAKSIDYATLFLLATSDGLCRDMIDRSIGLWSALAVSLVHQFDCRRLILGGGIMRSAELILPHIRRALDRACTPWGKVDLVSAALGDDAALLGLAVCFEERLDYL